MQTFPARVSRSWVFGFGLDSGHYLNMREGGERKMFQVARAACCQKTVCPPWQKGGGNEEPRHQESAWDPLGVARVQRRDQQGFPPGSANRRVPSGKESWEDRECTIALASPNLPLMSQFLPSPIEMLKERASNIPVTALLPPGTCTLSCWRAKKSKVTLKLISDPFSC